MQIKILNGDCLDLIEDCDCLFMDPPDNQKLGYNTCTDNLSGDDYVRWLDKVIRKAIKHSPHVWVSFNPRWTVKMGVICDALDCLIKPCVQTFTFGQNRKTDLGVGHRPLWRLSHRDAVLYPGQIKVPSWRELNGDKRAAVGGCVPLDVFDFPRVTGNSKQRRSWHPTQLHEDLVERCIKLTTEIGDHVIDPFGGTGTTARVCKRIERRCTLIELDSYYCQKISEDLGEQIRVDIR
jgi:DNA modification methylase